MTLVQCTAATCKHNIGGICCAEGITLENREFGDNDEQCCVSYDGENYL
jgi:hypothetical protein